MLKRINNNLYLAAFSFVQNCKQTYPSKDLMDEDVAEQFDNSLDIIRRYHIQCNNDQLIEAEKLCKVSKKKTGKLQLFKQQAFDCLMNNEYDEFNELSDEIGRMKNEYARRNYRKMLDEASKEYQIYLKGLKNER